MMTLVLDQVGHHQDHQLGVLYPHFGPKGGRIAEDLVFGEISAPPPHREGKIETDGERAGGILPPLAPKPS